jgi:DNA polymerase-3 subunit beta
VAAEDGAIRLAGTDLETFIQCRVKGRVEHDDKGAYTLPYRLFSDLVKSLPDDVVELQTDGNTVSIACGRNTASIHSIDADEFPIWDHRMYQLGAVVKADPETFAEALKAVVYAAANDESRPILTGVLFQFETGKATFAAADGFRLAISEMPVDGLELDEPRSVIVPAQAIEHPLRLLSDETEPVEVFVDGDDEDSRMIFFRLKGSKENGVFDVEMASSLIQGRFVNYQQIVPESHRITVDVDRQALETALRRASIFARYEVNLVVLDVVPEESKVYLCAESAEMGEHKGEVEARIAGEKLRIAFNAALLRDSVSSMPGDTVVLGFSGSGAPPSVLATGNGRSPTAVVMPMHIREG